MQFTETRELAGSDSNIGMLNILYNFQKDILNRNNNLNFTSVHKQTRNRQKYFLLKLQCFQRRTLLQSNLITYIIVVNPVFPHQ